MNYEQKQREAFYLIKKYSSYTWYAEIHRLWQAFCDGYERDFYRFPIREPEDSGSIHAGTLYEPGAWDEQNLKMFWGYAANMEEGLAFLRAGNKLQGYAKLFNGCCFNEWLYTRRFEEIDLSDFGYRRGKANGASHGIFAFAARAYDMFIADGICRHTSVLCRNVLELPDSNKEKYEIPVGNALKIPYGVPPGALPPLPTIHPNAPSVLSGEEVPAMGIWVVEPDDAHRDQTYCMAYLAGWAPALETVSEQEYEINTRYERTREEKYRKDWDAIPSYPVRWRLLWRDDRNYTEGNIPSEETDYLTYYPPASEPDASPRLRCEAGQPCPKTGHWYTPAKVDSRLYFTQSEIMPALGGDYGSTIWEWSPRQ